MASDKPHIQKTLEHLPKKPGVYQFYDSDGRILYVGKARVLKNRVSSYFNKHQFENRKTALLVKKIEKIEFIIVETEFDALLLENSLIKKHQPRYNIQLRDDKTYPWICIKNERFPRVFPTRRFIRDGSEYYGPYASVKMMKTILDLIKKLYKVRTCSLDLSQKNIEAGKFRLCLEYQIGNCLGPCEGLQTEQNYVDSISEIREIIKGNITQVIKTCKELMAEYAANLQFEQAQDMKNRIEALEKYQAKSTVVNPKIHNVDVFSIVSDLNAGYVNYMKVSNGAIIQSHTIELKKKLQESNAELLERAIVELRQKFESLSREIFVSTPVEMEIPNVEIHQPKIGDKKKLVELSMRNGKYYMRERHRDIEKTDPDRHKNRILEQLRKDLKLKEQPHHIECFDNSNMQGSFPVAACVVFKNAKPSKKDYRHFNIKTVEGPDDFASMEEVVYRRYKRLLDEDQPLPQLIVIDGGKGQLSSALKALEDLNLRGKINIIGIAKKLEEIYYPGDPYPLHLDKRSESLKIIQQLRNEAHRFGITHHRNKRSKAATQSELNNIKGIGEKTVTELLRSFKSVKRIKEASFDDLKSIVGFSKAQIIQQHFKS